MLIHRTRHRGQSGVTLVEILVALVVSGLVGTALVAAFATALRGTDTTQLRLERSNQTQRIGAAWTKDVKDVAPDGVNAGTRCPDPNADPSATTPVDEVDLIHFTRYTSPSATGQQVTASWVVVGRGDDMRLVRRECGAGALTEKVMATRLGTGSQVGTDVVHGPDSSNPKEFCPSSTVNGASVWESCTIIVDGWLDYSLTIRRRVPDLDGVTLNALPPDRPLNVTVSPRNGYLAVSWQVVTTSPGQPPITAYEIFVYGAPAGAPVKTLSVDGQSTAGDVDGLSNFVDYWVRVRAVNSVGFGEFSDTIGPVQPVPTPPESPLNVVAIPTGVDGQIHVTWDEPSNNGGSTITDWTVIAEDTSTLERVTYGFGATPSVSLGAGARSADVSGLTNGRTYRVIVRAHNGVTSTDNPTGMGDESAPSADVIPFGLPPAGTGVESQGGDAKAFVRWTPVADGNGRPVVGYRVLTYRGTGATAPVDTTGQTTTVAGAGCATTCQIEVPVANDSEYYRFAVLTQTEAAPGDIRESVPSDLSTGGQLNAAGQTAPKNPPYVRPSTAPATPTAPSVVSVGAGSTSGTKKITVNVTVGASSTNGGEPVEIAQLQYRSRPTSASSWSGYPFQNVNPDQSGADLAGQTLTYVLDNMPTGRIMEFKARVANKADWANTVARWSADSALTPLTVLGTPGAPTSVSLVRPDGSFGKTLTLSWLPPSDLGGESVTYGYSCTATGETARTSTNATSPVTFSDLRDGKMWTCAVTATNSVGTSSSQSSPAAMPYGECTVTASEALDIRQKKKDERIRGDIVATRVEGSSNEIWGFLRFDLTTNCPQSPGGSSRMPTTAYVHDSVLNLYRWDAGGSHPVSNKTAYLTVFPEVFGGKTMTASNISWNNTPSHATVISAQIATFNMLPPKSAWTQIGAASKTRELYNNGAGSGSGSYWWGLIPARDGVQNNAPADWCSQRGGNCAGKAPNLLVTFFSQGSV